MTKVNLRGSGAVTCGCGEHRDRCLFGRQHVWSLAFVDHHSGRPLSFHRMHCMACDSYCGLDLEDF